MARTGAITRVQETGAAKEDIQSELRYDTTYRQERSPQFVDFVTQELEAEYGAAAVQQGGIVVHTTLDSSLQSLAQQAVASGVARLSADGVNNGDLLAADPR
ncbi:MAG TPA: penicillin-binding protein, partial [Candidatus Dormibacteraeota bacterium]